MSRLISGLLAGLNQLMLKYFAVASGIRKLESCDGEVREPAARGTDYL